MPEIVMHVHLKPLAQQAFDARKASIMGQRRLGFIDSDMAKRLLSELYHEFFTSDNMEQADPDRSIGATCPKCKRLHIMTASVARFRCECYPYIQHVVAEHITVDGGVELPRPERVTDSAVQA